MNEFAKGGVISPGSGTIAKMDEAPAGFVVPIEFANKLAEFGCTSFTATPEQIEAVLKSLKEERVDA